MSAKRSALPIVLLVLGAAFVALGIFRGEVSVVLSRAANLCLECIGIG
jgi:hypothetical protein